jgi:hypothetical protein
MELQHSFALGEMRALNVGVEEVALRRDLLKSCPITDDQPRPSLSASSESPRPGRQTFKSIAKRRRSSFAGRDFCDTTEIIRRLRDPASD